MKAVIDISRIREAVASAAAGTLINRVYLFGSRARGDAGSESDIDLCVEASKGFSLIDAGLFADAVELSCGRPVDVISDAYLVPSMRKRILEDRVLLYER